MHVVLVYFQSFWCNSLLKCVSQPKIAKRFIKNPLFWGSRSFKVIDVDIPEKLIASACYDKQHVCAYLQSFSHRSANSNDVFVGWCASFFPFVRGDPRHPAP